MKPVLIAFASHDAQTGKIASHIAKTLASRGLTTQLSDLNEGPPTIRPDECAAAIVAGAIHRGRHQAELANYLMRSAPHLRDKQTAFLSISISAASHDPDSLRAVDEIAQRFLCDVGWHPDKVLHIAGAVSAEFEGTDNANTPTGDTAPTELTDWTAVDNFAASFADRLNATRTNQLSYPE